MQAQARASFTVRPCLDPGRAFEPEPKLVLLPSASEGKKWARMLFSARYEIEDERKTKTKKKRKKTATKNNFGQKKTETEFWVRQRESRNSIQLRSNPLRATFNSRSTQSFASWSVRTGENAGNHVFSGTFVLTIRPVSFSRRFCGGKKILIWFFVCWWNCSHPLSSLLSKKTSVFSLS